MKYQAKSFENIHKLVDFLNSNNIKPEDIFGIYKEDNYQDQCCFDLLYIESDKHIKSHRPLSDNDAETNDKNNHLFSLTGENIYVY